MTIPRADSIRLTSLGLFVLLLSCAGCAPEALEGHAGALLGGALSTDDPAAVYVVVGDVERCSGMLLHPRVVVTAAHCLLFGRPTEVRVGLDPRTAARVPVGRWSVPREYDPRDDHADVALLGLAAPVGDASPGLLAGAHDGLEPDERVRLVGFGRRERVERTTGEALITGVMEDRFHIKGAPARPCAGDSGGPALAVRGGREVIVGVASYAEPTCAPGGGASYTRLAPLYESFLEPVAEKLASGEDEPRGQMGDACQAAGACQSLVCVDGDRSPGYCSQRCVLGGANTCPAGFECALVEDDATAFACAPVHENAGCSVARIGAATPPAAGLLVVLAPALVLGGVGARRGRARARSISRR